MRTLVLMPHPPYPPHSGAQIRRWELLCYLAARHHVTVLYFDKPDAHNVPKPLQDLGAHVVLVPRPQSLSPEDLNVGLSAPGPLKWFGIASMQRAIEAVEPHSFDVVLVDSLYMTLYRELLPSRTVLMEQNIESQIYKQYARLHQTQVPEQRFWDANWRMLEQYENRVWGQFALRATVSVDDQVAMNSRCTSGKTIVVENGVNLQNYPLLERNTTRTLLFSGTLDYFPNLDAAFYLVKTIMPLVWRNAPDVTLLIAGRNPPSELVAQSAEPRVRVIANPEEMQPIAAQAALSIVPLRIGGGTRLKILEAFAWGLPVVSTSIGSQGLDVTNAHHLLVRDAPEEFAAGIIDLLSDADLYATLRANGRELVEKKYAWQTIFERFEVELETFLNSQSGGTA